jgi:Flp pilus assembly protein protease CpaA
MSGPTTLHLSGQRAAASSRDRLWAIAFVFPGAVWLLLQCAGAATGRSLWGTALVTLVVLVAVCAFTDTRWHKIPNWATYPAIAWALAVGGAVSYFGRVAQNNEVTPSFELLPSALPVSFGEAAVGAATCFLVMLAVHTVSGGGAGDVKLATAIGSIVGLKLGVLTICYAFVLAGVAALTIVIWSMGPSAVAKMLVRWIGNRMLPMVVASPDPAETQVLNRPLPLGVFFALATLMMLVDVPRVMP